MSVAATNYVWYVSTVEGSDRLVLLALADFADEDGNCFGSWGKLCQKTRLCRATIATSLKRLRAAGHLVMVEKGHRKLAGDGAEASIWKIPGVSEMGLKLRPVQDLDPSGLNSRPKWSKSQTQVVQDLDPNIKKHKEQEETKSADAPAAATPLPSPPISAPVIPRPKKPKFDPGSLPLPHGTALANAWAEFAQHRREIRAPLTPTAAKRIVDDLASVNEVAAVEALRKSVKHGWRGVFVDKPADESRVVVPMRTGPIAPSDAEKRMMALEALQAQMKGAA